MPNNCNTSNDFRPLFILMLVTGLLGFAIIDKDYRPIVADLAKISMGSYIGWKLPKNNSSSPS